MVSTGTSGTAVGRVRPALHFIPRAGWINDPHGIVFAGGVPLLAMDRGAGPVWLLADADLIEVVADGVGGIGTARCPVDMAADVRVDGPATVRVTRFAARPSGQSRRHAST